MATDTLLVGKHEMDILAMIASGVSVDEMLTVGPWSLDDVAAVVQRHGMVIDEHSHVVLPAVVDDQALQDALSSPSPVVRREAARAIAQLLKLRRAQATLAAQEASDGLRRLQLHAVQSWLDWLAAASKTARGELARLRASSPRSARAKRAAS